MDDSKLKQTKIQTGVVNRIIKDKKFYEQEIEKIKSKIVQMKEVAGGGGDQQHSIAHHEAILSETRQMLPDTLRRLKTAAQQLEKLMENVADDETELSKAAREALESAKVALEA